MLLAAPADGMRVHDPTKAGAWIFQPLRSQELSRTSDMPLPSSPTEGGGQVIEWDPDCTVGIVVVFPKDAGDTSSASKANHLHFSGKTQRYRQSNVIYKYSSINGTDSRCVGAYYACLVCYASWLIFT